MDRTRVVLAEIFRPRGVRGELIARSLTDIPGRLESLKQAQVRLANGMDRAVELARMSGSTKAIGCLKFAGVDSMDAAQEFRGADLWVPVSGTCCAARMAIISSRI